jgi:hypothetical protein
MTELAPEPVWYTNETPSGVRVDYCPDPRTYKVNGREVPSVTTILDILHKPALTWWGMKVGIEGVYELMGKPGYDWETISVEDTISALTEHKLTVNHVRDKAADRGSSVHQAFEDYCAHGIEPNPDNYPPSESGYVRALIRFMDEVGFEVIHAEVMVGSARHGYAGRFDLLAVTVEQTVKTGPRTERTIPTGMGLIDLKTSKGVYQSHKLQLAGYREALEECGYGRTNYEGVILARLDGTYDFQVSDANPAQFLAVLGAYKALKGLK